MKYTSLIVDDEALAREELRYLLEELEQIEIVGEAADGRTAVEMVEKTDPDLLFLDIQMPEMDGFAVVKELMERERVPHIIFATAYDQYALKAFEANAVDYLLKPIDQEKLLRAVERLTTRIRTGVKEDDRLALLLKNLRVARKATTRIPVRDGEEIRLVDVEEVVCVTQEGRKVTVQTHERVWETNYPDLTELEASLPVERYLRVDGHHLVNVDRIKEIIPWSGGNHRIILDDAAESQIPINRAQAQRLKAHLEGMRGRS